MLTFEDSELGGSLKLYDKRVEFNNSIPNYINNDFKEISFNKEKPLQKN